ncbi:MAG: hypothetical protein NXI15_18095 [Gammaproteobacteria bacterium]|nr:hypothetical protein [Gammaproteobacteria bacterium]
MDATSGPGDDTDVGTVATAATSSGKALAANASELVIPSTSPQGKVIFNSKVFLIIGFLFEAVLSNAYNICGSQRSAGIRPMHFDSKPGPHD